MSNLEKLLASQDDHIDNHTLSYQQSCLLFAFLKSPVYYNPVDQSPLCVTSAISLCANLALYFIHVINWFQDQSCTNAYFHNDGFELLPNDAEPFSTTSDLLLKAIDRLTRSI